MGVLWALLWAFLGLLIGVSSLATPFLPWDVFFTAFDAPLPALGVPGFIGGMLFGLVTSVMGQRRRFRELSLRHFAAWGAIGGILLSLVPLTLVTLGLASVEGGRYPIGTITSALLLPGVVLGTGSAVAAYLIARRADERAPVSDLDDPATLHALPSPPIDARAATATAPRATHRREP
ncbi:MAG: hypothetical protein RLZZ621_2562 [Gemmatimonadota bacterium]